MNNKMKMFYLQAINGTIHETAAQIIKKSIELAKQMQNFNTIEDFLSIVKGVPESEKPSFVADRMGVERASAPLARPAACTPALQVVPLTLRVEDPAAIYFPPCTRVKRCGGCCNHRLLSCQPTEVRLVNYEIAVTKYINFTLAYKGKELIPVEVHDNCTCKCSITANQCNHKQDYIEDECRCICSNTDDEAKCKNNSHIKIWDSDKCECGCREIEPCHEGLYFDKNTCRCQLKPRSRDTYYTWEANEKKVTPPIFADIMPRRKHKDEPIYK
ncbi:PDGF- and VEGF-related factor 1 isoform X2 [Cotesia typhae]|uniref:PDGF- and VEGF-related factor 1 isoform X2 n=1 Tax=Cotesia typhae TaxID=2053667 RepID=UPI003D69DE0A